MTNRVLQEPTQITVLASVESEPDARQDFIETPNLILRALKSKIQAREAEHENMSEL